MRTNNSHCPARRVSEAGACLQAIQSSRSRKARIIACKHAPAFRTAICILGLFVEAIAFAQRPPETTPTEFPGAETFVYAERDSGSVRLFVVKPADWQPGDRRSALMFFFGGGWTTGTPRNSIGWARTAARLGMVGIVPDYRTIGRSNTTPLESVADSRAALRWIQDHAAELGIDPARIVVGGNSAGGHVALWTAIAHAPPGSDDAGSPLVKPAALILFSTVSDTSALTGYTPKRFGGHATALSPVHQLDESMPPVLAFHGDSDALVPVAQATTLRDKLVESGNVCELHIVPGGGHNFGDDAPEWKEKSRTLMLEFLKRLGLVESGR